MKPSSSSNNKNNSSNNNTRNFAALFSQGNVARAATSAIARKATTALSKEQLDCIDRLEDCVDRVLECKRRDMHLKTLQQCIATFTDDADKDEPLTTGSFSVYDCYRYYTQELIYFPEKFDFLIFCIMHRICTIHKPRLFNQLLDDVLMPATAALAQRIGGELLTRLIEEDEMRDEDEMNRVEHFVLKKDWVPAYSVNSPLKFLRQQEEEVAEKKRQQERLRAKDAQFLATKSVGGSTSTGQTPRKTYLMKNMSSSVL